MKHTILKWGIVGVGVLTPALTFAAGKTLRDVITTILGYFSVFMTLVIGLAMLTFVWNVYNYFFKADVENKKEAGLYVMYSTIGFFVILSIWGLVNILINSLNLDNTPSSWWPFGTGAPAGTNQGVQWQGNTPAGGGVQWQGTTPPRYNSTIPGSNIDPSLDAGSDIPADPSFPIDPSSNAGTDVPATP